MKYYITILLFSFLIGNAYSQYKLKDIPFSLAEINKSNFLGKQGVWFFYDKEDSTIFAMQHFLNDTLNGYFERYWRNGIISEKGFYKKGQIDSIFIAYWENGIKRGEAYYSNGLLHGVVISYDKEGEITSRIRYVKGEVDSSYADEYIDNSVVWDSQERDKIDTILTTFPSKWDKRIAIYVNDTLLKEIDYYKGMVGIESFYDQGILCKRIIYYKKEPSKIEKVFYYKEGELIKKECYNKKEELLKECR